MGLTIHYSSKFNPKANLADMIEEVEDIAKQMKWKYRIYETEFPEGSLKKRKYDDKLYGICIMPPECEPVVFSFLSNGRMSSSLQLGFYGKSTNAFEKKLLYMMFTKTQFAGWQVHAIIINMFKYISNKYFLNFELKDEGHYWETGSEITLRKHFGLYEDLLSKFTTAFETIPANENEDFMDYIKRMGKWVRKMQKEQE